MTPHEPFEEMLARRSELTPIEESRLQSHLRDCPLCRATADAYARQQDLLRALPSVAPPPALRARVLDDLARPRPRFLPAVRRPAVLLAPLGASLAAIALAFAFLHQPHTSPESAPRTQQPSTAAPTARKSAPRRRAHHTVKHHQTHRRRAAPAVPPPSSADTQIALQAPLPTATPGLQIAPPAPTATIDVRRPRPAAHPPPAGSASGGPTGVPPPTATPTRHPTIVVVAPRVTPTPPPTPTFGVPVAPVRLTPTPVPTPSPNP